MKSLKNKKLFIFDMDGTIYLGDNFIDGAVDLLDNILKEGNDYVFLTNNSSKNSQVYYEKLKKMGLNNVTTDKIFTSGEATRSYIKQFKPNSNIYLLGNEYLEEEFKNDGFNLITEPNKNPDYVVLGFDTTLTYNKIWHACDYIKSGVEFLATHPDFVCPLPQEKTMPDTGAMIEMFKLATGGIEPKIMGKPNRFIIDAILNKYNLKPEDAVMVGDRLYTDIQLGINSNMDTILVLTGESTKEDIKKFNINPTFTFESVKTILQSLL